MKFEEEILMVLIIITIILLQVNRKMVYEDAVLAMYFIGAPIVHDYLAGNFYGTSKSIFTYIFSRAVARKII